jgi:hypothetical protein
MFSPSRWMSLQTPSPMTNSSKLKPNSRTTPIRKQYLHNQNVNVFQSQNWIANSVFFMDAHLLVAKNNREVGIIRYAAVRWSLPTAKTILAIELDWDLPHLVSNCESQRPSFQVWGSRLRCKDCKRSNWRFSFSLHDHIGPPNRLPTMLIVEPTMVSTYWRYALISS